MVEQALFFRYRALDRQSGDERRGELTAPDAHTARQQLRQLQLDIISLDPLHRGQQGLIGSSWAQYRCRRRRLARGDLADAIATLLKAGLPLEQAIGSIALSDARSRSERVMLRRLREQLRNGAAIGPAVALFPDWFDPVDQALLAAGQQAGDLISVLESLSAWHLRQAAAGHKLLMALAYPALLLVLGLAVVGFIATQSLPELTAMLIDSGQSVPALTQWVMAGGQWMVSWAPLIVPVVIVVPLLMSLWRQYQLRQQEGAPASPDRTASASISASPRNDAWFYRLVRRNMIAKVRSRQRVARLAATLAHLQRAGLPLTEALQVTAATVGSGALASFCLAAADSVHRGEDLSTAARRSQLFDPEFAQLLELGEASGELVSLLERIAERYARAAERSTERLTALLEPLAIIALAILIGVVVIAAALPLVALGDMV